MSSSKYTRTFFQLSRKDAIRIPLCIESVLNLHCSQFWALCASLRINWCDRQRFIYWLLAPESMKALHCCSTNNTSVIANTHVNDLVYLVQCIFGYEYQTVLRYLGCTTVSCTYKFNNGHTHQSGPYKILSLKLYDAKPTLHIGCVSQFNLKLDYLISPTYLTDTATALEPYFPLDLSEIIIQYVSFTVVTSTRVSIDLLPTLEVEEEVLQPPHKRLKIQ